MVFMTFFITLCISVLIIKNIFNRKDISTVIPVGINENRHLMEWNNRKAIALGTNIYSIELSNHWKLNETAIYIYTSCDKPIAHKAL